MTRTDYGIIARAISRARKAHDANCDQVGEVSTEGVEYVVDQLCMDLKDANPRFDPYIFRKACA